MARRNNHSIVRLTPKNRLEELGYFLRLCFASLDKDVKEVANRTHLSTSTIYRLRRGSVGLRVQFKTIQAIGYAAGLQLEMTESSARIVLV